jgi:hypothetical protein
MEVGSGRAHCAEQRSGERIGAGTGAVATWRWRGGGSSQPADGTRPAAAQDCAAGRTGEGEGG